MSWTLDEQGEEQRQIFAFDDDSAMVRSVHVTMTVQNVIAGAAPDTSDVRFGLIINNEEGAEAVRNDFVGNSYVAFLNESPLFDYETSMYGVEFDGGLLCHRGDDQGLDCPALDDSLVGALAIKSVTAQDLEHQG